MVTLNVGFEMVRETDGQTDVSCRPAPTIARVSTQLSGARTCAALSAVKTRTSRVFVIH